VANDEVALLELINAITALADGGELTWAIASTRVERPC